MSYTKGGVTIYKTVTDEQEQRDYWISKMQFLRKTNRNDEWSRCFFTKDFHKSIILDSNMGVKYDGPKIEYLKKSVSFEDIERLYAKNSQIIYLRNFSNDYYVDNSSLKHKIVVDDTKQPLSTTSGYLNYCNPKHNTLSKTDPNYRYSCTNADEIIKKYNLKNVIKVPKSPYVYSTHWSRILPLGLTFDTGQVKNYKTKEILGENTEITFWGGWFINLLSPFENRGERFNYLSGSDLQELIIPNPYKIRNNKGTKPSL